MSLGVYEVAHPPNPNRAAVDTSSAKVRKVFMIILLSDYIVSAFVGLGNKIPQGMFEASLKKIGRQTRFFRAGRMTTSCPASLGVLMPWSTW
jgi:hypothetical protein